MTSVVGLVYYRGVLERARAHRMAQHSFQDLLFHQNQILFGHDSTPGLIAFEIEGLDRMKIFHREDNQTLSESVAFRPFLLLEGEQ